MTVLNWIYFNRVREWGLSSYDKSSGSIKGGVIYWTAEHTHVSFSKRTLLHGVGNRQAITMSRCVKSDEAVWPCDVVQWRPVEELFWSPWGQGSSLVPDGKVAVSDRLMQRPLLPQLIRVEYCRGLFKLVDWYRRFQVNWIILFRGATCC